MGSICGGGRYDNLVGLMGGGEEAALGFGLGFATTQLLMEDKKLFIICFMLLIVAASFGSSSRASEDLNSKNIA